MYSYVDLDVGRGGAVRVNGMYICMMGSFFISLRVERNDFIGGNLVIKVS